MESVLCKLQNCHYNEYCYLNICGLWSRCLLLLIILIHYRCSLAALHIYLSVEIFFAKFTARQKYWNFVNLIFCRIYIISSGLGSLFTSWPISLLVRTALLFMVLYSSPTNYHHHKQILVLGHLIQFNSLPLFSDFFRLSWCHILEKNKISVGIKHSRFGQNITVLFIFSFGCVT